MMPICTPTVLLLTAVNLVARYFVGNDPSQANTFFTLSRRLKSKGRAWALVVGTLRRRTLLAPAILRIDSAVWQFFCVSG